MWIGGVNGGISVFSPGNLESCANIFVAPENMDAPQGYPYRICCLVDDDLGRIWVATARDGIWVIDAETKKVVDHIRCKNFSKKGFPAMVYQIFQTDGPTLLAGTDNGLWEIALDPISGKHRIAKVQIQREGFTCVDFRVTAILKKGDGFWLFTNGSGIITGEVLTTGPGGREFFRVENIHTEYQAIDYPFADREGGVWMNIHHKGGRALGYFHPALQRFNRLSAGDDIVQKRIGTVEAIHTDDHRHIFMGTCDGLYLYDDSTGRYSDVSYSDMRSRKDRGARNFVDIYKDIDGTLYCLSRVGIARIVRQHNKYVLVEPSNHPEWKRLARPPFYQLAPVGDSLLVFVGTYERGSQRLYVWNRKLRTVSEYPVRPVSAKSANSVGINCILTDTTGSTWLGANQGICRFDVVGGTIKQRKPAGFALPDIQVMQQHGRYLWLAPYSGGCFRFDPVTNQFRRYRKKDGFEGTSIGAMQAGHDGKLWISTEKGISCLDPVSGNFRNYDNRVALTANSIFMYFGFEKDGLLYFGNGGGVTRIDTRSIQMSRYNAPMVFTQIKATATDGKQVILPMQGGTTIVVGPAQKTIDVEFGLLSYVDPSQHHYAYRLEEEHSNWMPLGTKSTITFSGLPPGTHRLHVKASDSDGVWNERGAILVIRVLPQYWETLWFRLGIGVVGLGVLFLVIRNQYLITLKRERMSYEKQLAVHEERKRISRDMHDDLGTSLVSLQLQVDSLLPDFIAGTALDGGKLKNISWSLKSLVISMREIVWTLNPEDDNQESALMFVRKYVLTTMETAGISATVRYPDQIPRIELSGMARRNIFLCVKEALNNVIKHAGATRVELSVSIWHGKVKLLLKDNGCRNLTGDKFSNGLRNMEHRMKSIGASFDSSFSDQGTVVSFTLFLGKAIRLHRPKC